MKFIFTWKSIFYILISFFSFYRELQAMSKQGSADPYVSIKLVSIDNSLPIQKRKTAVVQQSLEPQFDNQ